MLLAKLQSMTTTERRALAPGLARLLVARLFLVFGIRKTSRWLGRINKRAQAPFDSRLWEARGRVVKGLSARLPGMACLTQSLALRWWMRADGLEARMKIGVRQVQEQLKSHAWVELEGKAIAESGDNIRQFRVIETY